MTHTHKELDSWINWVPGNAGYDYFSARNLGITCNVSAWTQRSMSSIRRLWNPSVEKRNNFIWNWHFWAEQMWHQLIYINLLARCSGFIKFHLSFKTVKIASAKALGWKCCTASWPVARFGRWEPLGIDMIHSRKILQWSSTIWNKIVRRNDKNGWYLSTIHPSTLWYPNLWCTLLGAKRHQQFCLDLSSRQVW